ncbi:MAG TPA: hypothetical protein VMW00_04545 [Dehalococcoidales bacterium]|nr:hypothetical protein [Dehalococcoidales bacterium]
MHSHSGTHSSTHAGTGTTTGTRSRASINPNTGASTRTEPT